MPNPTNQQIADQIESLHDKLLDSDTGVITGENGIFNQIKGLKEEFKSMNGSVTANTKYRHKSQAVVGVVAWGLGGGLLTAAVLLIFNTIS